MLSKRRFAVALALCLVVVPSAALAAGAYIGQVGSNGLETGANGAGGAFVMQLPADARPAPPAPARPANKKFQRTVFLTQPAATDQGALDQAVEIYGAGQQPKLPSVGGGVAVALVNQGATTKLPDVGSGVMN